MKSGIFFHAMNIVRRHVAGSAYPDLEKVLVENEPAAREFYRIVQNMEAEIDDAKRGRFR